MKYDIDQIKYALISHSLNESQLFEKRLLEVHDRFVQIKTCIRQLNESNDENAKTFEKTIDVTENHMKDLKSPEDFKRFVEKNRDKVETALKNMPEKKRPAYKKAWDLVCKAARGTVKFIMLNFVAIAQAVLILALGWVFRDQLKWLWNFIKNGLTGQGEQERFDKYKEAVKQEAGAAKEFTQANKQRTNEPMYKRVMQDYMSTEKGKEMLAKIKKLPLTYANRMAHVREENKFADEVHKDPVGLVSLLTPEKDDAYYASVQNELHKIGIEAKRQAGFQPSKDDEQWSFFDIGYTKADIDGAKEGTQFYKDVAAIEKELYQACANAKTPAAAKKAIYQVYHKYDTISLRQEQEAQKRGADALDMRQKATTSLP